MDRVEEVRFSDEVELGPHLAEAARSALEAVKRRAGRRRPAAWAILSYLLAGIAREAGDPVVLGKEPALDVAAGLLVVADELHGAGLHLEAFALEGLQGHVMEAALRPT
jgi:hypothetical protein